MMIDGMMPCDPSQTFASPVPVDPKTFNSLPFEEVTRNNSLAIPLSESDAFTRIRVSASSTGNQLTMGRIFMLFGPRIPRAAGNGIDIRTTGPAAGFGSTRTVLLNPGVPTVFDIPVRPLRQGTVTISGTTSVGVLVTAIGLGPEEATVDNSLRRQACAMN